MAAGLGFKDFVTGEVLTAADVDGYLMQGVWVFASAAARDAAVTSPQEGNFAYLKDTNVTTYYTGSAWANLDTTGMTNPMTTTGDTIYSSSGSTPARLGIGSTGQVLTVAAGVPSWATPAAGGGMTLLSTTTLSSTSTVISGISGSYKDLLFLVQDVQSTSTDGDLQFDPNGTTQISYVTGIRGTTVGNINDLAVSLNQSAQQIATTNDKPSYQLYIFNYADTSYHKPFLISGNATATVASTINGGGSIRTTSAITSMTLKFRNGQTFAGGRVLVYGVN